MISACGNRSPSGTSLTSDVQIWSCWIFRNPCAYRYSIKKNKCAVSDHKCFLIGGGGYTKTAMNVNGRLKRRKMSPSEAIWGMPALEPAKCTDQFSFQNLCCAGFAKEDFKHSGALGLDSTNYLTTSSTQAEKVIKVFRRLLMAHSLLLWTWSFLFYRV